MGGDGSAKEVADVWFALPRPAIDSGTKEGTHKGCPYAQDFSEMGKVTPGRQLESSTRIN